MYFKLLLIISAFILMGCTDKIIDEVPDNNIINISKFNGKTSHRQGENCGICHKSEGEGKGWFTIGGTIYDSLTSQPYPNILLKLYTGPSGTGTLVYELEGDSLGNFFTTEKIDFGSGLYPVVYGKSSSAGMGSHLIAGNCNGCHGITTNRIKLR